jgi:hypothetical protein
MILTIRNIFSFERSKANFYYQMAQKGVTKKQQRQHYINQNNFCVQNLFTAGWKCDDDTNIGQHKSPLAQLRSHVGECRLHGQDGASPRVKIRAKMSLR